MNNQQNAFLVKIVPDAQNSQNHWGVPASVTIAQAIEESSDQKGWGQSSLALLANNYFGIKGTHLLEPDTYIKEPTHEYIAGKLQEVDADFERYPSVGASFDAHAQLLATALRYKPAMAARSDPESFCIQLQKCGYSTNPNYAVDLWRCIQDYDLTQYDLPPAPAAAGSTPTSTAPALPAEGSTNEKP